MHSFWSPFQGWGAQMVPKLCNDLNFGTAASFAAWSNPPWAKQVMMWPWWLTYPSSWQLPSLSGGPCGHVKLIIFTLDSQSKLCSHILPYLAIDSRGDRRDIDEFYGNPFSGMNVVHLLLIALSISIQKELVSDHTTVLWLVAWCFALHTWPNFYQVNFLGKINNKRRVLTNAACKNELDGLNHCTLKRRVAASWPFHCRVTKGSAVTGKTLVLGLKRMLGERFYVQ